MGDDSISAQSDLQIEAEKILFSWKAPSRPFKKRDREFWVTVGAIAFIGGLILFVIEGLMPVLLILSIIFLYYILSTVPPEVIEYTITNRGVKIAGSLTEWQNLTRYWFSKRFDTSLLVFEMITLPGRLELVVLDTNKDEIRSVLNAYVVEEEASPSGLEKMTDYFSEKLPIKK